MSADTARGPGGLVLHEAGLDPSRLDLSGGPSEWTHLPAMGLRDFVVEHLQGDDPARVCLFLDAPRRTTTRAAAALACARSLLDEGRSVVVVDGDDQRPDLSAWAQRTDIEGWVDVVRYGVSLDAASVTLPWGEGEGRVMGVGSYHPVRAEKDEAATLVRTLLEQFDTVLVCGSTGDRGAYWSDLDALRIMCWDRAAASPDEIAALVRDTAVLGESINATIAFGVAATSLVDDPESETPVDRDDAPRRSSPIFRRLAISLTVLIVVLGSWFLGQMARQDSTPVVRPEQPVTQPVATETDSMGRDDVSSQTEGVVLDDPSPDTLAVAVVEVVAGTVDVSSPSVMPERDALDESEAERTLDGVDWAEPVLDGVYCLHVFSMADSVMAREQLQWMDRRGVAGLVRRWRDSDGKVWYRIYAGNFATLAEARTAVPDVNTLLETDWAMPKRTERIR